MKYKYKGKYNTSQIVQELILTLLAGTPEIKRANIEKIILEFHKSQGGHVRPKASYITTALKKLEEKGFAETIRHGYYRILSIYDYNS